MGCSHAVHLIMNINLTAVGRAFRAGAALVEGARLLDDLESAGCNKIYLLSTPTTEHRYQTENGEIFTVIVSVVLSLQLLLLLMNLFVFVMNPDVVLTGCLYLSTYSAGLQGMVTYVIG